MKGQNPKEEKSSCSSWVSFLTYLPHLKLIIFGQSIAFSLACCSAASSTLQNIKGIENMPLLQISVGYFFIGLTHLCITKKKRKMELVDIIGQHKRNHHTYAKDLESKQDVNELTSIIDTSSYAYSYDPTMKESMECYDEMDHHSPWYFYAVNAFIDVNANFSAVLSFRYTSLISSNILTSLCVLSVMVSSRILLAKKFTKRQIFAAFLCILGGSIVVSSDVLLEDYQPKPFDNHIEQNIHMHSKNAYTSKHGSSILGDIFAIVAAFLFGVNDTLAEYCVRHSNSSKYLTMLGFFGFGISILESFLLEHRQASKFFKLVWNYPTNLDTEDVSLSAVCLVWSWYTICLLYFYTSVSHFLSCCDATFLSLSLQTSNVWTILFSVVLQTVFPTKFIVMATSFIIVGVYFYEKDNY